MRPIPAAEGPQEGQIAFLELDEPPDSTVLPPVPVKKSIEFPRGAIIGTEVTDEQGQKIWAVLEKHRDAFDVIQGKLPCTDVAVHHIETGGHAPKYIPPYRCSKVEEGVIQKEVDKLVDMGIVRERKSPWGTSTVLVAKKDGEWRLCIDFGALNRITQNELYPMPVVEELVNDVRQSSWFCLLDLRSAYWQVPMDEESIPKTAFSTRSAHYEFLRMAMGLKAAAGTFQRLMNHVIRPVRQFYQAYLDDLLTHADSFEASLSALEQVLALLVENKLLVSFKKCKFMMREVACLGYMLSKDGIRLDPARMAAIANLQAPKDVKSLQQVLGLFQYYTRFHLDYAAVAALLTDLTKKAVVWKWSTACQEAFEQIKRVLTSEPVVARPDFSLPFVVQTDWSLVALGAILAQEVWDEWLQIKQEVVVYYASKKLKGPKLNYSATEGECQAAIWAIKLF